MEPCLFLLFFIGKIGEIFGNVGPGNFAEAQMGLGSQTYHEKHFFLFLVDEERLDADNFVFFVKVRDNYGQTRMLCAFLFLLLFFHIVIGV